MFCSVCYSTLFPSTRKILIVHNHMLRKYTYKCSSTDFIKIKYKKIFSLNIYVVMYYIIYKPGKYLASYLGTSLICVIVTEVNYFIICKPIALEHPSY